MDKQMQNAEDIIRNHVIFSMTAGAIPVPVADFVAVSAIQLDMIKQLADLYKVDYDVNKGKSLASSLMGATVSRIGSSFIKAIPGVGTIIGIGSQVVMSGATTYALGIIFDSHFSRKEDLDRFNIDSMKEQYRVLVKKGKEYAKNIQNSFGREDVFSTIEKLSALKTKGDISEEEYNSIKEKLLKKIG